MSAPVSVPLVLARRWNLYAFPEGVTPTDERGIAITLEELGQIIEPATAAIVAELDATRVALEAAQKEAAELRDMIAESNTTRVLRELRGDHGP